MCSNRLTHVTRLGCDSDLWVAVFELLKLFKGGLNGSVVKFGFEGKMVEMSGTTVTFEFDESHYRSKNVILLSVRQLGRRLG